MDAEAVVVATEWKEFLTIDWQAIYNNMYKPAFIFDGRLLLDATALTKIGFKVCIRTDVVYQILTQTSRLPVLEGVRM